VNQLALIESPETTGDRDCWGTPGDLFRTLDAEFHFAWDLAAEPWSAKCENYFTPANDAFQYDWTRLPQPLWLNPPFSDLSRWIGTAWRAAVYGATVVAIVPAHRCEQAWWHQYVIGQAAEVRCPRGRVEYVAPPGIAQSGPKFPSCVLVYRPGHAGPTIMRAL
jgi:site-specific DNA-methyltransferase (adenine-specific)